MTTLYTNIDQIINTNIDRLSTRLKQRIEKRNFPVWLLQKRVPGYTPDYLLLGTYGRTRKERLFNTILSTLFPALWRRLIWPRIVKHSLLKINTKYLDPVFPDKMSRSDKSKIRRAFLDKLEQSLRAKLAYLPKCTFMELFNMVSELLGEFSQLLNGHSDIYRTLKTEHNQFCLTLYESIVNEIKRHPNKLRVLTYLTLRSNWIDVAENDYAPFLDGLLAEVNDLLEQGEDIITNQNFNPYFKMDTFEKMALGPPRTILYELDNCGEIIFDLALIDYLLYKKHRVILCAKEKPVLNDATVADVMPLIQHPVFARLKKKLHTQQFDIINNTNVLPGKYAYEASPDYIKAYKDAHLLILKGQGNFQSMPIGYRKGTTFFPYTYKKPIFFLMGVKADLTAQCLERVFSKKKRPLMQSVFLYYFHPRDKTTFPK